MENQVQNTPAQETKQAQGYFGNPQVFLNRKQESLTHILGNDLRIEMPVNFYKKILGLPFEKKEQAGEKAQPKRAVFGLVARPIVYVKGNYLVHSVLGIRVSKHVNYYKKILTAQALEEAGAETQAMPA